MQHHEERLELERIVLDCRVRGEKTLLGREEDWCSEDYETFDLQCGESLAVAANRIGEEIFGVRQLLRCLARGAETALALVPLVTLCRCLWAGGSSKQSERERRRST
jgi:hypothetical protein